MDFHAETQSSWESNAVYWDEHVGLDGNKYWKTLQEPSLQRLLGDRIRSRQGTRALDLATGNGLVARWLANNGCASVLATDGAAAMLEQAKLRASTAEEKETIEYKQLDVTSAVAFEELAGDSRAAGGFDVITINMAIMDIADIEPLAQALPKLLKPDGVFVASILHPVFFTSRATRLIEVDDNDSSSTAGLKVTRGKVIREYMHIPPYRGVASYGQPAQQVYFHRSMHELFGIFFRPGLVMDGFEELAFSEEDGSKERIEVHTNFPQLPAILAFRLRRHPQLLEGR
ncbi:putative S-adenosyl-L-methionine-dependent methyltransferase [Seiridium cardinale]